ncbi:hypothetical protein [Spirochaeta dissipatitropha]
MTSQERNIDIVGKISSLKEQVPWTIGLSTLFECITWQTEFVLGMSKTQYWKRIVHETLEEAAKGSSEEEIIKYIDQLQKSEIRYNRGKNRWDKVKSSGLIDPYEALRRMRFHSEDYLNREFDIFLSLAGNQYLDAFYKVPFPNIPSGMWSTHSNSTLLMENTRFYEMQFDNLAYNIDAEVLIANELKLRGRKNPDQILKHLSMFLEFKRLGFISNDTKFNMLFIGFPSEDLATKEALLQQEQAYCLKKSKRWFLNKQYQIMQAADDFELRAMSWEDFIEFNNQYIETVHSTNETLLRLIHGMNSAVREKIEIA